MTTFIPPARRNLPIAVARKAVRALPLLAALAAVTAQAAPASDAARRPTQPQASRTIVDREVQLAGGACHQCGPAGCKHGHHRDCRDGACVPYCPVRPSTFGFYGTQWRRWPGSGVVPVSNEQATTPVKPPKSSVPGPDEESMGPKPSELPEPDFPADDSGAGEGRGDIAPEPLTPEPTTPAAEEPSQEPAAERGAPEPKADAKPEAAPAKPRPQDENLFDDSAARRVRRKIPVAATPRPTQSAQRASAGRVQPVTHQEAAVAPKNPAAGKASARAVPRVPFDPRKESDQLRKQAR